MKTKPVIDWKLIWKRYGKFHNAVKSTAFPEWKQHSKRPVPEACMAKIQELVEQQISEQFSEKAT